MHDTYNLLLIGFIGIVLLYFVSYLYFIKDHVVMMRACLLILAGGFSNFIDRIWYGSVIDFIQLHVGDWYFPVFNVADVSITFGAIMLFWAMWFSE